MIVNKEKQLLDTIVRIEKNPKGMTAIRVFLSRLNGKNKQANINLAYKVANNLSPILQTTAFELKVGDMILIGRNISLSAVDDITKKIISVLKNDSFFDNVNSGLFKTYTLDYEFNDFKSDILKSINQAVLPNNNENLPKEKFSPEILDEVIKRLETFDIQNIIRRQAAAKVIKGKKFEIVFKEYFLSIKDLNEAIFKNTNLTEDFWLFRHLSEHLDAKMLKKLVILPNSIRLPKISLNLNINTIFSREFLDYTNKYKDERIICEFQIVDILNNIEGYFKARDYLIKHGHSVLIDCINTTELEYIDIENFKPSYVKMIWDEDIIDTKRYTFIKELAYKIGGKKIILSRADSDKALSFGNALGIELYQGYYVDTINAIFSKTNCKYGSSCSLEECANAKREISGDSRKRCKNLELLDKDPVLKNF